MSHKTLTGDELLEEAKAGRRLTSTERRRVIVHLEERGEIPASHCELARLLSCSEKTIRLDRQRLLIEYGDGLTATTSLQLVSKHFRDLETLIITATLGLHAQSRGALGQRHFIEILLRLYKERREAYEAAGLIKKSIGELTLTAERWIATVAEDGQISVAPVEPTAALPSSI